MYNDAQLSNLTIPEGKYYLCINNYVKGLASSSSLRCLVWWWTHCLQTPSWWRERYVSAIVMSAQKRLTSPTMHWSDKVVSSSWAHCMAFDFCCGVDKILDFLPVKTSQNTSVKTSNHLFMPWSTTAPDGRTCLVEELLSEPDEGAGCLHFNEAAGVCCIWIGTTGSSLSIEGSMADKHSSGGGVGDYKLDMNKYIEIKDGIIYPLWDRPFKVLWVGFMFNVSKFLGFRFNRQLRSLRCTINICASRHGWHEQLDFLEPDPAFVVKWCNTLVFLLIQLSISLLSSKNMITYYFKGLPDHRSTFINICPLLSSHLKPDWDLILTMML